MAEQCHVSGVGKTSPVLIFSYSGPSGILVLTESRIPLKPVLGGLRIVAFSINTH